MKKIIPFLCALALTPLAAFAADKVPSISHDELVKAVETKQAVVIDVNGTESYRAGHIPGAIDFQAEQDQLASKLPKSKDALVVAYCGNEQCGAYMRAAKAAKDLGYTNVKHYSPGIAGWKKSSAPLEKSRS
jgi:rhodanese-related sulfurtransferase